MGSSKATSDFRRRRKLNLVAVCGNACNLCGYDKIPDALEFHHIDPNTKEYGIASDGNCRDIERDLAEVKKTILVCSNCHREIHKGLYETSELENKKIFNEAIAQSLIEQRNAVFTKTLYYCSKCGAEITRYSDSGLCAKCFKETTRKCERPERIELKELIRNLPFTQIGEKYGVTDNAVRKWCKNYGLPVKKTEIKAMNDEEWLKI